MVDENVGRTDGIVGCEVLSDQDRAWLGSQNEYLEGVAKELLEKVRELVDAALSETVVFLRLRGDWGVSSAPSATWQEIGEVLGVSRQAAQQRFGSYVELKEEELADPSKWLPARMQGGEES